MNENQIYVAVVFLTMEVSEVERFRESVRLWIKDNTPNEIRGIAKGGWLLGTREINESNVAALRAWQRKVYEAKFLGMSWPTEFGGGGRPVIEEMIAFEEFTQASVPYGGLGLGIPVVGPSLLVHGTQAQKQEHLQKILSAEELWCQGFSEPGAGSDLANITTSAIDKGDYFLIKGHKIWSSYADMCDHMILLARTGPDRYKGLTMFILQPLPKKGMTTKPIIQITGGGEFCEVFLDEVEIPRSDIIGNVGDGWRVAMTVLNNERLNHPFLSLSVAEKALKSLQAKKLDVEPLVQETLAAKMFYLRLLDEIRRGKQIGSESGVLKFAAAEILQQVYEFALESLPLEELTEENWFETYLATRASTIAGGTSEILRNVVGERVLELPR